MDEDGLDHACVLLMVIESVMSQLQIQFSRWCGPVPHLHRSKSSGGQGVQGHWDHHEQQGVLDDTGKYHFKLHFPAWRPH